MEDLHLVAQRLLKSADKPEISGQDREDMRAAAEALLEMHAIEALLEMPIPG